MTLHEYPDVEQGTDAWFDLRRGIVTASTVHNLVTAKTIKPAENDYSRGLTMLLASERITGWTYPTYQSMDMLRGCLDEPVARDLYSKTYAPVTEMGFMVYEFDAFSIGFSPDGLVADVGLIEIKSRRPRQQVETILAGEVPLDNIAQCQAGLLVSGREWVDYVSFSGGLPLFVKRVLPDQKWFDAIVNAAAICEQNIRGHIATYQEAVVGLSMTERIDHFAEATL